VGTRKYQELGVWSEIPKVREPLSFNDDDTAKKFFSALHDGSIGMVRHTDRSHGSWYQLLSCGSKSKEEWEKAYKEHRDKPGPGEIWLGVENDHDIIAGFSDDPVPTLDTIYKCCRKDADKCCGAKGDAFGTQSCC